MFTVCNRPALLLLGVLAAAHLPAPAFGQLAASESVFRSAIDYVSITAVVRDERGRTVSSLSREDFEVLDAGRPQAILDLQAATSSPASVAQLIDGSGSMHGQPRAAAIAAAGAILDTLNSARDDAALFSFDTRLLTLKGFTADFDTVRAELRAIETFGSTSLFDAIGGTAGIVARRTQNRRAVVVFTDGGDNASAYEPSRIAGIASSIDVPVYVFDLSARGPGAAPRGALAELAAFTGGSYYRAGDERAIASSVRALVDELRHQYVMVFEAAAEPGFREIEVKTRKRGLRVRSRSWYLAGGATADR